MPVTFHEITQSKQVTSANPYVHHYGRNTRGRDFAVGDIHGYFTRLGDALIEVGFDPECDRLFCVGDLVDRGPESGQAPYWLDLPWLHAVQGNHEEMAIRWAEWTSGRRKEPPVPQADYLSWGGAWFMHLSAEEQVQCAAAFSALPYAMEVETEQGLVGIIHAEVWGSSWPRMAAEFDRVASAWNSADLRRLTKPSLWEFYRRDNQWTEPVEGARAVIVGHATVDQPMVLGNVHYIDTGGWREEDEENGAFTFVNLATLETVTVENVG